MHENWELTNQSNSIPTRTVTQEGMQGGNSILMVMMVMMMAMMLMMLMMMMLMMIMTELTLDMS